MLDFSHKEHASLDMMLRTAIIFLGVMHSLLGQCYLEMNAACCVLLIRNAFLTGWLTDVYAFTGSTAMQPGHRYICVKSA